MTIEIPSPINHNILTMILFLLPPVSLLNPTFLLYPWVVVWYRNLMAQTRRIPLSIKLYIALVVLLGILLLFEYSRHNFIVTKVVDGDTIILNNDELVRLIGVDTPEINQPFQIVEHYGRKATAFTKKMVEGKAVRLEHDGQARDEYGRWLMTIRSS